MTRIAFIHDHKFYTNDNQDAYSAGKLSVSSFERYFEHFDKISIISRFININETSVVLDELNKVTSENIDFIPFEDQSNLKNRFILRNKYKALLKEKLKNVDALVIRVPSEIGFLASEVAVQQGIPFVCEVVACPADAMDGFDSIKAKMYKKIIVNGMRKSVLNASGAIYVTEHFLQNKYPTNGFQTNASNVEINAIKDPKKLVDKNEYEITLTGNLDSHHKGYDVLFKALDILDKKLNTKLLIHLVGRGTYFKKECNYQNIVIKYPGVLNKQDLFNLLDRSDLYIQPSNQEGLPRATIEAMSRALPCVVSNAGGLPELINHKHVHDKHSPQELADKIYNILNSHTDYNQASHDNTLNAQKYLTSELKERRSQFYTQLKRLC